jgi:hypothetical protein
MANYIPRHAVDLLFTAYGNLSSTDVQAAIQELDDEKATTVGVADYADITDYGASMSRVITTLNGDVTGGATSAILTDASTYAVGNWICIPGAGVAGAEHDAKITSIDSNTVHFTVHATVTTD